MNVSQTGEHIQKRITEVYREKEVNFPVAVGINNFLADRHSPGQRFNREALVHWANNRFNSQLTLDDLKSCSLDEIEDLLCAESRRYLDKNGDFSTKVDELLELAYGDPNGQNSSPDSVEHAEALEQLTTWSNREFNSDLRSEQFAVLSRKDARQKVLNEYDQRYRPELCQAERSLILEVLDTAWKDHLYYMDHLRQGIGLVGYAQKDPKVEYKREGMKAFDEMWERIGQQVTSAIFRLEMQSPEFVGSLWEITGTIHEEAGTAAENYSEGSDGHAPEPGEASRAVDTIRNRSPKVGRNDICPCGSGKKFKKCCGMNA